jgi:hypothetical protein
VADADREQLDRGAAFDLPDDSAQVSLEVAGVVLGQRRLVERGPVRHDHQDPPRLWPT